MVAQPCLHHIRQSNGGAGIVLLESQLFAISGTVDTHKYATQAASLKCEGLCRGRGLLARGLRLQPLPTLPNPARPMSSPTLSTASRASTPSAMTLACQVCLSPTLSPTQMLQSTFRESHMLVSWLGLGHLTCNRVYAYLPAYAYMALRVVCMHALKVWNITEGYTCHPVVSWGESECICP